MKGFLFLCIIFVASSALANISFSPFSVHFGDVSIDRSFGPTRYLNLYNNTNERLSISITDNCFSEFRVSNSCFSLAPYGSCSIRAEFRPRRDGYHSCRRQARGPRGEFSTATLNGRGVEEQALEVQSTFVEE